MFDVHVVESIFGQARLHELHSALEDVATAYAGSDRVSEIRQAIELNRQHEQASVSSVAANLNAASTSHAADREALVIAIDERVDDQISICSGETAVERESENAAAAVASLL